MYGKDTKITAKKPPRKPKPMTYRTLLGVAAVLLLSAFASAPKKPVVHLGNTLVRHAEAAIADTLVSSILWSLPNDGKGPLDSVAVTLSNISGGTTLRQKFSGTGNSAQFRQPIPAIDTTFVVSTTVCTFRGKTAGNSACASASANFVYGLSGPLPVTGLTITNTKIP